MEESIGSNAVRFVGEMFLPGASQYVSGHIGSGLVHSALAAAAGGLLITSGVAPLLGTLAVVGVKLNSYATATTGRGLLHVGAEAMQRATNRFERAREPEETTVAEANC